MHSMVESTSVSKAALWAGWVMSAIPILMILFGSIMKLIRHPSVIDGFAQAGLPAHLIIPVGLVELVCVVVYAIPRTSILGAILMTGLLGGAILTELRIGNPTTPLPLMMGILAWAGLYLRDPRLRQMIPLRRTP